MLLGRTKNDYCTITVIQTCWYLLSVMAFSGLVSSQTDEGLSNGYAFFGNSTTTRTEEPTDFPTDFPIVSSTKSPSRKPVVAATNIPSALPSKLRTPSPTLSPTSTPSRFDNLSAKPTLVYTPTSAPSFEILKSSSDLYIVLTGIKPMDNLTKSWWEMGTSYYYENFYNDADNEQKRERNIFNVQVKTLVTGQSPPFVASAPGEDLNSILELKVSYNQTFSFSTTDPNISIEDIIVTPLLSLIKRNEYLNVLQDRYKQGFSAENMTASDVKFAEAKVEVEIVIEPPFEMNLVLLGSVAAAFVALLAICVGFCCIIRKKCNKRENEYIDPSSGSQVHLSQTENYGRDEVSTLAEPAPRLGVIPSNESLAGYEERSIATIDYDYSKAYGGGTGTVSSAGGTRGDTISTPVLPGQSLYSGDTSFNAQYQDKPVKEQIIDIFAPPGKLGVVIDTPDEGAPVVHAIKDSSVIADKLKVGDKLIAVDGEDVRAMTAIKVSKVISRKSGNAARKLTIVRSMIAD